MRKPSRSIHDLLNAAPQVIKADDLQQLLKEHDNILAEQQQEAIQAAVANGLKEWRPIIEAHWVNIARIRVELVGVLKELKITWADGLVWRYPPVSAIPELKEKKQDLTSH